MNDFVDMTVTVSRSLDHQKLERSLGELVGAENNAETREKIADAVSRCIQTDIDIKPNDKAQFRA